MPYNPGVTYTGPQLYMQGMQNLGQGVERAVQSYVQQRDEQNKQQFLYDTLVNQAQAMGYMSPEDVNKYQAGNLKQKQDIAAKAVANIHWDETWRKQEYQQAQLQDIYAQAEQRRALAQPFEPKVVMVPNPQGGPDIPVMMTSRGQGQPL